MKLNTGLLLILSLFSLSAGAQNYPFPPGKIFNGITPNNQNCRLQLNTESDGWLVELDNDRAQKQLLFNSNRKVEVMNAAWISRDVMSQVSNGHFESLTNVVAPNKIFNISMRCKLNAKNEPVAFTLDLQEAGTNSAYKRVVNCQVHQ
jgi:hypothetical protein